MKENLLDKIFNFLESKNKHFKKLRTIGKYTFFSVIATLTDLLALFVLTEFFNIYYLISVKISYFIGMIVAFFGNKKYTFKKTNKKSAHQFLDFFIISVIDLCLNVIIIKIFTEYLGIWYILSKIITVIIIFIGKYYLHKEIAYNN